MREEEIERLRGVVRDCVSKHLYSSAIFFADKVAGLTSDPADIYMQAQALFLGRQYRRAHHILVTSQIIQRDLRFRYLAAKCLEELEDWQQCLTMLGDAKVDEQGNINSQNDCNISYMDKDGEDREINISSAICFLRGKAYEALENRAQAHLWYKAAVKADPLCYEALAQASLMLDEPVLLYELTTVTVIPKGFNILGLMDFNDSQGNINLPNFALNLDQTILEPKTQITHSAENAGQYGLLYKMAFKMLIQNQALECLVDSHMLTCEEEKNLLSSLQFSPEDGWLSTYYSCLMKKYDKEEVVEAKFRELEKETCGTEEASFTHTLQSNTDLLACKAEYYQQCGEYQKCFELTSGLLEKDPYHLKCMVVHLAAAMELGRSNELYLLSCNLVKDYPQKALSWFAVGCYYHCIKKYNQARQYFCKATKLDATFPPAWIGFGNAFSAVEENDQAMSAYRTAVRLFPGSHLPTLYIGMEYMRTHHFKLAEQFFLQAKSICPSDPFVYNELGVVAYYTKEYQDAVRWFEKTLALLPSSLNEIWEPTLVNLAHSLRKLKMYHEAIKFYEKALTLSTGSVSTYAGLAYTYHLQDNFEAAITYYHKGLIRSFSVTNDSRLNRKYIQTFVLKALWLKPDDQFCTEMLTVALEDECRQGAHKIDEFLP